VISKGLKVNGSTIKKRVYHKTYEISKPTVDESNISQSKSIYVNPISNPQGQSIIEEKKTKSNNDLINQQQAYDQQIFQSFPPQSTPISNTIEVERLKKELSKSMIYLTNLKEEQKIKKRELDMLSKGPGVSLGSTINEVEIKKGISPKIGLIGFIIFFLIGYYLAK